MVKSRSDVRLWSIGVSVLGLSVLGLGACVGDLRSESAEGFSSDAARPTADAGPLDSPGASDAAGLADASRSTDAADDSGRTSELGEVSWVRHWNEMAIDASGRDHTPLEPGEHRVFGEQLGPGRASRAMAIVHVAIFEAMNAIVGGHQSYVHLPPAAPGASMRAAIAQAARDTLVALFPSQAERFDEQLSADLDAVADGREESRGVATGAAAAAAILTRRQYDGAAHPEPALGAEYATSDQPGHWRQDPISRLPVALGARWREVAPFVLESADQFRPSPPPALDSAEYATAYEEVARLGGDGRTTPTSRTEEQTFIGVFWAYDGTPSLCAPPRLYNQIAMTIAEQERLDAADTARLLALVNVAMADTGIAVWEAKYHYDLWRPVTGIREADEGTGPTGRGDGNSSTVGDPTFTPLGAPASNTMRSDFTPPFPSYPSGHAAFGGALFQTLRRFFGRDDIAFTFVSDEFDGETADHTGMRRPYRPRSFGSFSQAEEENGQSRIYLGIHWSFDKTSGIAQGRAVADHVFDNLFASL
jgi:hypothetical protein